MGGARRVMYWRQSGEQRTMQNFLELTHAVQANLNILNEKTKRWSAEVTMRKRGKEADAPGMFLTINAKDIAPEVFTCTLDASVPGGAGGGGGGGGSSAGGAIGGATHRTSSNEDGQRERTVLVIRAEKRCVLGDVPVKEYLARCRVHKLAHKCRIDGVEFRAGDFAVRIGRVENMQGTYAGAVVEVEYAPVSHCDQAEAVLAEYAGHVQAVMAEVGSGETGTSGGAGVVGGQAGSAVAAAAAAADGGGWGTLVAVPREVLRSYKLDDKPFSDAHLAVLYVHTIMTMQ